MVCRLPRHLQACPHPVPLVPLAAPPTTQVPAHPAHANPASQDGVDQHLTSGRQVPALQAVMGGTFAQQIICREHDFRCAPRAAPPPPSLHGWGHKAAVVAAA